MSSIGEAKARIEAAAQSAGEAERFLLAALEIVDEALTLLNSATVGSQHEKAVAASAAYNVAKTELAKAAEGIDRGRLSAVEYAAGLG